MVLADSHRLPLAPWYLGYFRESICFYLRDYHPLWCSFPEASVNKLIFDSPDYHWFILKVPQHLSHKGQCLERVRRFRLFPFRSPLLRKSLLFSLPGGTEMFHFSPFAFVSYEFTNEYCNMTCSGLPHSEIVGSEAASALPTLIAGNRVLHSLLVPRHPPYALSNLTKKSLLTHQWIISQCCKMKVHQQNFGQKT